jgi:hypothetical protein
MMLASLLPSLWVRENGVGDEPLYSPYITSPSVAAAAQAVNRSSSESDGSFDEAVTHFFEDGSSGVGFPGMGYLNHD